ncbi:MAG: conserved repeat protein [Planctomycetota bacterium]|nr:conserved repeat protein [Planctomycetota bacterium]
MFRELEMTLMGGRRFGSRRTAGRVRPSRSLPALEALESRQLLATFTVTNNQDLFPGGGVVPGSLRDAINKANLQAGADNIVFNIAGTGIHTILPDIALPPLTDTVKIDGTTQPGYAGQPVIEIDGSNAGVGANGLRLDTGNIMIRALAINRFRSSGIRIESGQDTVQLCFIGTTPAGNTAAANGNYGIFVDGGANNIIGGFDTKLGALGNVISGNTGGGINLFNSGASNNVIVGNFIGTDVSGARALPNTGNGISIVGGAFNQIGGQTAGQSNVISGNTGDGVSILGASARNTSLVANFIGVDGNPIGSPGGGSSGGNIAVANGGAGIAITGAPQTFIGGTGPESTNIISGNKGAGVAIVGGDTTIIRGNILGADATGVKGLGNLGAGVSINGGDGSQIGGTLAGAGNIIAFNGKTFQSGGVNIFSGRRIPILSNSIFGNFGLGTILFNVGGQPVANDGGDPDQGPNDLQNYPVLTKVATAAGRTLIQGSLNSQPNTTYTVQFFSNVSKDPSNFGEGQTLLGQTQVTTDSNGIADINITLPTPSVIGQFISATATDSQGNTSEFALDIQVVKANQANLSVAIAASPNPATLGSDLTYTITVVNNGPDQATNVQLVQTLPPGVTFKSGIATQGSLTSAGTLVLGNLGAIDAGTSVVATVLVAPSAIGSITTTANVSSGEIDPDTTDNQASQTTVVDIPADLGLILTSDPARVTVGQNTQLSAIVNNFGPGAATGTVLRVALPAGVSFVTASLGQGSASFANGIVTANLGTLASGVSSPVYIVVTAPIFVPSSGVLSVTASVSANEIEPAGQDPTPNQVSLDVPVDPSSDVSLSFVGSPEPILAGSNLTYFYTVINNGPSPATGIVLTDIIPAGMTFVAAPPPSQGVTSFSNGVVTVSIGSLGPSGVATGTITVTPTKTGVILNTATVALDQPDPNTANNTFTAISTVSPADLSVKTSVAPDPVEAGHNLTYTLFISNNGPADATNVQLSDLLPSGVVFVSAIATQGDVQQLNGKVTGTLGAIIPGTTDRVLAAGSTVLVTIVVTPPVSAVLTNTATISSDQIDINPGNNTQTVTTNVSPADLGVSLGVSPNIVLAGDPLTFTAFVTNTSGPSTANNVVLRDLLPAGLQFVSATSSQGTVTSDSSGVTARLGSLPAGGSATVTIIAKPLIEGAFTNSVSIVSDQVDPDTTNNTAQVTASVINGPGVLQFAASTFTVGENSGAAIITVVRTSGNRGSVAVNFSTSDGTGLAGLNYKATSGTLVFNDGETSKTFSVPLIDDGSVNGNTSIHLSLTSPTGGASVGANSSATLISTETDFDVNGPKVVDVQVQGSGRFVTGVTLVFDEALDPSRATNPGNYTLMAPGKNGRGEIAVAILPPTYNPVNHTVTITSGRSLALNSFYRVIVNGAVGTGVTDIFGNALQGADSQGNGQNYMATFARGSSLKYADHDGDLVTLNLSNGGLLDLYRSASGDGQVLRVLGAGARRSVLSGNVKRGSFKSDGVATFNSIIGANFGQVDSRLTTPKFFVDSVTAFIKGSNSSLVRASSVSVNGSPATGRLFARSFARRVHH